VKEGAGRSADDDDDAEKTKFRKHVAAACLHARHVHRHRFVVHCCCCAVCHGALSVSRNLESSIVSSTPNVKWADVAGLEGASPQHAICNGRRHVSSARESEDLRLVVALCASQRLFAHTCAVRATSIVGFRYALALQRRKRRSKRLLSCRFSSLGFTRAYVYPLLYWCMVHIACRACCMLH
jgi:hypothetical protein